MTIRQLRHLSAAQFMPFQKKGILPITSGLGSGPTADPGVKLGAILSQRMKLGTQPRYCRVPSSILVPQTGQMFFTWIKVSFRSVSKQPPSSSRNAAHNQGSSGNPGKDHRGGKATDGLLTPKSTLAKTTFSGDDVCNPLWDEC